MVLFGFIGYCGLMTAKKSRTYLFRHVGFSSLHITYCEDTSDQTVLGDE